MPKRRTGRPALAYTGVNPATPPNIEAHGRAPTANDRLNFVIGDLWIDSSLNPPDVWMLVSLSGLAATWIRFGTGADVAEQYTTDGGIAVPAANNLNVLGGGALSTTGAGATLIITDGGLLASTYTTDAGNAIPAANVLNVVGAGSLSTSGAGSTVTITDGGLNANSFPTDVGTGVPVAGVLNIIGAGGTVVSAVGNTITVTGGGGGGGGANTFVEDVGVAVPAVGVINIAGGTNINTFGAGAIVTVHLDDAIDVSISVTTPLLTAGAGNDLEIRMGDDVGGNLINFSNQSGVTQVSFDSLGHITGNELTIDLVNIDNGNIEFPSTNAAGTEGVITRGGGRFIHTYTPGGVPGFGNLFVGGSAGNFTTTSGGNVGIGGAALNAITSALDNTAVGNGSMIYVTSGSNNCGIGENTFYNSVGGTGLVSGSYNIAIGINAGTAYTAAESYNTLINSSGVNGENSTLHIGDITGAGAPYAIDSAYICGIWGKMSAGGVAVYVNNANKLGTVTSSLRYKQNVQDMGILSEDIYKLRPVSFQYKECPEIPEVGLIAEEVDKVMPWIVVYDKDNQPETVRYHELVPLLLNELQKLKKEVAELRGKIKGKS